jgi:choline kinase
MTLVILAAGMGSRFGGMKQITPVGPSGEFIIDYSCYDAIKAGFDKIVFVIKRENLDIFRDTVGKRVERHVKVEYAFQEMTDIPAPFSVPEGRVKPWGTGHALLSARDCVSDNFATINADDFYGAESYAIMAEFLRTAKPMQFAMAGYKLSNTLTENGTVSRGICVADENGMLTEITERTAIRPAGTDAEFEDEGVWVPVSGDSISSMNFFGFTPEVFGFAAEKFKSFLANIKDPLKSEYYLPSIASLAMSEGLATVKVCPTPSRWYGVTYAADKPMVVAALADLTKQGKYPETGLWK